MPCRYEDGHLDPGFINRRISLPDSPICPATRSMSPRWRSTSRSTARNRRPGGWMRSMPARTLPWIRAWRRSRSLLCRVKSGDETRRDLVGLLAGAGRLRYGVSSAGADRAGRRLQPQPHRHRDHGGHHLQSESGAGPGECPACPAELRAAAGSRGERLAIDHP